MGGNGGDMEGHLEDLLLQHLIGIYQKCLLILYFCNLGRPYITNEEYIEMYGESLVQKWNGVWVEADKDGHHGDKLGDS